MNLVVVSDQADVDDVDGLFKIERNTLWCCNVPFPRLIG